MSDTEQIQTQPTKLAFALGSLSERVSQAVEAQKRLQDASDTMPERIVALLHPRLIIIEANQTLHDSRITTLERDRWKVIGGGVVLLALAGIIIGHPIK
jgi:hypothetical protein